MIAPITAPGNRARGTRRHHGILPIKALPARHDWGEQALQRTWRSAAVLCMALGLLNAFVARLPALMFVLAGIWAHFKGHPLLGRHLAQHPVWGAPLRWWLHRGQHLQARQAPDTRPQM